MQADYIEAISLFATDRLPAATEGDAVQKIHAPFRIREWGEEA